MIPSITGIQSRTIRDVWQDENVSHRLGPTSITEMQIGLRVAEIREHSGLTQSALARSVGTSQSAISQIEAGERNPSYEMLRQIAEALGVSVPHLVGADVETLTREEEVHFRQYRGLPEDARRELQDFAAYLRHKHGTGTKKPPASER